MGVVYTLFFVTFVDYEVLVYGVASLVFSQFVQNVLVCLGPLLTIHHLCLHIEHFAAYSGLLLIRHHLQYLLVLRYLLANTPDGLRFILTWLLETDKHKEFPIPRVSIIKWGVELNEQFHGSLTESTEQRSLGSSQPEGGAQQGGLTRVGGF